MALPGSTMIHHGSYATVMLLLAGLALLVSYLPARFVLGLLTVQAVLFSLCWVFFPLPRDGSLDAGMVVECILAFLSIAGLLTWLAYLDRETKPSPQTESVGTLSPATSEGLHSPVGKP
jgi:hypothetical protein